MPSAALDLLLADDQAKSAVQDLGTKDGLSKSANGNVPTPAFLSPFKPKADTDYRAKVAARTQSRSRSHETLVNNCAEWLRQNGLEPARNAAVDLGLLDGSVIIEAKVVSNWADATRQAVGQLYEYHRVPGTGPRYRRDVGTRQVGL